MLGGRPQNWFLMPLISSRQLGSCGLDCLLVLEPIKIIITVQLIMTHSLNNPKCQRSLYLIYIFPPRGQITIFLRALLFHIFLFMVGGSGKIHPYLEVVCRVTACLLVVNGRWLWNLFSCIFVVPTIECFVRLESWGQDSADEWICIFIGNWRLYFLSCS